MSTPNFTEKTGRQFFLAIGCKFYFCLKTRITCARKKRGGFETECFLDRVSASTADFNVSLAALVASVICAAAVLGWGL
jgi:hypothetical protein